jgi:hypothetical protein
MTPRGTVSRARAFTEAQGRSDQGGRHVGPGRPMAKRVNGHMASLPTQLMLERLERPLPAAWGEQLQLIRHFEA